MRKLNSQPKQTAYQKFLINKVKEEHEQLHQLRFQYDELKKQYEQVKNQIVKLRRTENQQKITIKQLNLKINKLEQSIEEDRYNRRRKAETDKVQRIKSSKQQTSAKIFFKQFLSENYPRYKQTVKRVLKWFMLMQKHNQKSAQDRINSYVDILCRMVKKIMDFIIPKPTETQKNKSIAQNMIEVWKNKPNLTSNLMSDINLYQLQQQKDKQRIQFLQAQVSKLTVSKNMLQNRLATNQKTLRIKGSQFIVYLKKMLASEQQFDEEANKKIQQVMAVMNQVVHNQTIPSNHAIRQQQNEKQSTNLMNNIQIVPPATNKIVVKHDKNSLKKAPPIVKKNVFGYYEHPQLQGNLPILTNTKLVNNNKATQTLADDLTILITNPVLQIIVFDANIKPQRNRHRLDYYVRIHYNKQKYVNTHPKAGFQPIWNQGLLLTQYDFPFIGIQLMNMSKGIRDFGIANNKVAVSACQSTIVRVKDDKGQFQGRVRLGIRYPKGNIYRYTVTSVQLIYPQTQTILRQKIVLKCPLNSERQVIVTSPNFITYCEFSFLIIQDYQGNFDISIQRENQAKQTFKTGKRPLHQFVERQGNKIVEFDLKDTWKVILHGQIYLLVSKNQQPEKIIDQNEDRHYFAVRAGHPVKWAKYNNDRLQYTVKVPMVFRYKTGIDSLEIGKDKQKQSSIYSPLLLDSKTVIARPFIKVPQKVVKLYIESLQGSQVKIMDTTMLYEKLLQNIKLRVKDKYFHIQSQDLMENYYKVFQKTFKKQGYIKFKLGYKIHQNQLKLQTQGQIKKQKQEDVKIIQDDSNKFKAQYISLEITSAYLPEFSNMSSYSCICNSQQTSIVKGYNPIWTQQFILEYNQNITYQVIQHPLIGFKKVISEGTINLKNDIAYLRLGCAYIRVGQNGVLVFGKISLPNIVYSYRINKIEAIINEDQDWIGEIDPYLRFFSMNRQLYKTYSVDGTKTPTWSKLNFDVLTSSQKMLCYIYDEDIILKDDYLGECTIDFSEQQINSVERKIVKQGKYMGSIIFSGIFKKIILQGHQIKPLSQVLRISPALKQKITYRLKIFQINISQKKYVTDDSAWLQIQSKRKSEIFALESQKIKSLDFTFYCLQQEKLQINLIKKVKTFFSEETNHLGTIQLQAPNYSIIKIQKIPIINKDEEIGTTFILVQPLTSQHRILIGDCTSAIKTVQIFSDIQDSCIVQQNTKQFGPNITQPYSLLYNTQIKSNCYQLSFQEKGIEKIINIKDKNTPYLRMNAISYNYEKTLRKSQKIQYQPTTRALIISTIQWQSTRSTVTDQVSCKIVQQNLYLQINLLKKSEKKLLICPQYLSNSQLVILKNKNQIHKMKWKSQIGQCIGEKGIFYLNTTNYYQSYSEIAFHSLYIKNIKKQVKISSICSEFSDVQFKPTYVIGKNAFYWENIKFNSPIIDQSKIILTVIYQSGQREQLKLELQKASNHLKTMQSSYYIQSIYSYNTIGAMKKPTPIQRLSQPFIMCIKQLSLTTTKAYSNIPKIKITAINQTANLLFEGNKVQFRCNEQLMLILQQKNENTLLLDIWVEGILSNQQIGSSQIKLTKKLLQSENQEILSSQVKLKNKEQITGKLVIKFKNISQAKYAVLGINRLIQKIARYDFMTLKIEQINNKVQYEVIIKPNKQNNENTINWQINNENHDCLMLLNEQQNIRITVFRYELMKGAFTIMTNEKQFIKPLRLTQLNGLIIGQLSQQILSRDLQQNTSKSFTNISIVHLDYYGSSNQIRFVIENSSRKLQTKAKKYKSGQQIDISFAIESDYQLELTMMSGKQQIGIAKILPPYVHGQTRVVQFYNQIWEESRALGLVNIQFVSQKSVQLVSIQARNLINTQYFTDMTPYVQMQINNKSFITQLGKGRDNLFWQLGITAPLDSLAQFILYDKDMFLDDFIGKCNIKLSDQNLNQIVELKSEDGKKTGQLQLNKQIIQANSVKKLTEQFLTSQQLILRITKIKKKFFKIAIKIEDQLIDSISYEDFRQLSDLQLEIPVFIAKSSQKYRHQASIQLWPQQKSQPIIQSVQLETIQPEKVYQNQNFYYQFKSMKKQALFIEQIWIWSLETKPNTQKNILVQQKQEYTYLQHKKTRRNYINQTNSLKYVTVCFLQDRILPLEDNRFSIIVDEGINMKKQWSRAQFIFDSQTIQHKKIIKAQLLADNKKIGQAYVRMRKILLDGYYKPKPNIKIFKSKKKWLKIMVNSANIKTQLEIFSKMDPYCIIEFGQQKKSTSIQQNVGVKPIWNEEFIFTSKQIKQFKITLKDSQIIKDRDIGQCLIKLDEAQPQVKRQVQSQILINGSDNGILYVQLTYINKYIVFTTINVNHSQQTKFMYKNVEKQELIQQGIPYPIDPEKQITIREAISKQNERFSYENLTKNSIFVIRVGVSTFKYMIFQ